MHRHVVNVLLVLCVSLAAGGLATLSLAARQAPQGPKTHWEPYKHKPTVPQPQYLRLVQPIDVLALNMREPGHFHGAVQAVFDRLKNG